MWTMFAWILGLIPVVPWIAAHPLRTSAPSCLLSVIYKDACGNCTRTCWWNISIEYAVVIPVKVVTVDTAVKMVKCVMPLVLCRAQSVFQHRASTLTSWLSWLVSRCTVTHHCNLQINSTTFKKQMDCQQLCIQYCCRLFPTIAYYSDSGCVR